MPAAYEIHEYSLIFPSISGPEFDELVESIRRHGQLVPITLYQGRIVDGRHRYRACLLLGLEPVVEEYRGAVPILDWVVATNSTRRHLNESQRAIVANQILELLKTQSGKRSRQEICDGLNVGVRTAEAVRRVQKAGAPELIAMMSGGQVRA